MPRYFFHFSCDEQRFPDSEGQAASSVDTIRREALRALLEMAPDKLSREGGRTLNITVRDESGIGVFDATLSLREALPAAIAPALDACPLGQTPSGAPVMHDSPIPSAAWLVPSPLSPFLRFVELMEETRNLLGTARLAAV